MIRKAVPCALLFILVSNPVWSDDQIRSTQEELRRRNIFFGDIDGRDSSELSEALKRYQSRKGLPGSGRPDRDTLRSLGLVTRSSDEPVPKALEWPEEPVLKSDEKLDVIAAAGEISRTTGVAADQLLPPPAASAPRRRTTSSAARSKAMSNTPMPAAQPAFSIGHSARLQSELTSYLRRYLAAVSRNRLEDELQFYADRVDYLGNGTVDRRIVEQSLRKYYQRWPRRDYRQAGEISYQTNSRRGEIVVTFRTAFSLSGHRSRVKGQTINRVVINAGTADPRIVSISEQRVRR